MISTEAAFMMLLSLVGFLIVSLVIYHISNVNEKIASVNDKIASSNKKIEEIRALFFKYILGIDIEHLTEDDIIKKRKG